MANGFVQTGLQFPDSTIQTTAASRLPVAQYIVSGPGATTPSGYVAVNAAYSKEDYSSLYGQIGDETHPNMIPVFSSFWTTKLANIGNPDTDQRSGNRIATNGSGTWIVLGASGIIYRSINDGESWTSSTPVSTVACGTIAYGGGVFVVGGVSDGKLLYSTNNGASWAQANNPLTNQVWSIAYQNGFFLATNNGQQITKSTDGINWTQVADLGADSDNTIGAGGGYFVLVNNADGFRATVDGVTWTTLGAVAGGEASVVSSIRYFGGRFFVVGDAGSYAYTAIGSDPRNIDNWIGRGTLPLRDGSTNNNNYISIGYIEDKNILFIQDRNGSGVVYWTTIERPDLWYTRSTAWPSATSGADCIYSAFNNTTLSIAMAQTDTDGYGNPVYGRCIVKFNPAAVSTPPTTHFWVSGDFYAPSTYFGQTAKVFVKA